MARWARLAGALLVTIVVAACGGHDRSEDRATRDEQTPEDDARSNAGAPLEADGAGADVPGEPDVQTADEAAESDLQAVADSLGITVEQAREARSQADVLGNIQQQIYEQRPEIFVGGALAPPRLYIKGEADEFVRDLVGAAPFAILIIDRQPYSFDDNDRRVAQFARELQRLGFNDFAVSADIMRESLIEATVRRVPGAPDTVESIMASLPSEWQTGVAVALQDEPVVGLN